MTREPGVGDEAEAFLYGHDLGGQLTAWMKQVSAVIVAARSAGHDPTPMAWATRDLLREALQPLEDVLKDY